MQNITFPTAISEIWFCDGIFFGTGWRQLHCIHKHLTRSQLIIWWLLDYWLRGAIVLHLYLKVMWMQFILSSHHIPSHICNHASPSVFVIVFVFPIFTMTSMHFPKLRHCPTQNFKLLKLETSICSKRGWGESFFPFNMCSKIILFNTALNPGVPWQYFSCFFNATLMLWVFSWLDPILGFRQYHCGSSRLLLPMQFGLSVTPG